MPKKSAINRGRVKLEKLMQRIITTVKAQYPNASDEYVLLVAANAVHKYAMALGYYEGVWRGVKTYLESVVGVGKFRQIAGPVRSAVLHIARLITSGASDDEIQKTIEGYSLPDDIKTALKNYFIGVGAQKA